jgi:glyoxylase-like metal-dependent hydrolase (beta-lactamase superfamily II)
MIFEQIDAGGDRNFSYLIGDDDTRACAVVDPGYDTSKLEARVKALGLHVTHVLNTHTHHDHIAGNHVFHKDGAKLAAYRDAQVKPDIPLEHGSVIDVGKQQIQVLFTPRPLSRFDLPVGHRPEAHHG